MRLFFNWSCLLLIALVAPIALPAGGAQRIDQEFFYEKQKEFNFAGDSCFLLSSPSFSSPTICHIKLGTPVRIIRYWENEYGETWLHVQASKYGLIDIDSPFSMRGWINF